MPRNLGCGSTVIAWLACAVFLAPVGVEGQADLMDRFGAIGARNVGPAGMSGRIAAIAVDPTDHTRIFAGAATGGVFRSTDGGHTWTPVFDGERVLGVGSISVSPVDPSVVWVGTGEGNPRNSAGVGFGLWKSEDGGSTWDHVGFEGSERIHRVIAHPTNRDVAYVGSMGPAWSDGDVRGVYKTDDGGESWRQLLYVDERTGVADMVMDPTDPDRLFVAMWDYRREPWFFTSGGEGSGLYLTEDGGESWRQFGPSDGLPSGPLGRIGLEFSLSSPNVVYALIEAERSALLRSDDGGESWRTVTDRQGIAPRPFYYADLRVDTQNEDRIYSLHSAIQVSDDSGESFRTVVPSAIIHGDVHELWINPNDSRHMIMGNDGGVAVTRNRGETWRFVENLALAQFYRIQVDDAVPFNIYGGLQDNGSWYGPMTVWENKGILNAHWFRVGGGDGFHVEPDWSSARHGYSMSQQGNLQRFDRVTGERNGIRPRGEDGERLRFNWNAAFAQDPHDSTTIYLGSQYVHRSRDQGATWDKISPDLTTNDPEKQRQSESGGLTRDASGAENHTTILDIAPSPLEPGVLWASTDDGNVQLTRDGGSTWTEVGTGIPDIPPTSWAADVQPSVHDAATAYVVFDEHRRGDWTPYVFRTEDYGASWARLSTDDVFGFAHDIAEDPVEPNLLFLGTEFGLYASVDRGESWGLWTSNGLPPAPVRESVVHPRDGDLVVGTHGRAAWVVDDIRPLREVAANREILERPLHLFEPPPAVQAQVAEAIGYRSTGFTMFQGETRPTGALLTYSLAAAAGNEVELEITSLDGQSVATIDGPREPGIHRVSWDLRADADAAGRFGGDRRVSPGVYRATLRAGGVESSQLLRVLPDPRGARP